LTLTPTLSLEGRGDALLIFRLPLGEGRGEGTLFGQRSSIIRTRLNRDRGVNVHDLSMPQLSNTMETGKIIAWKVKEGDPVKAGQIVAEVETDKAVMEMESPEEGVLATILRGEGEEAAVGEVIARIAAKGEKAAPEASASPGRTVAREPSRAAAPTEKAGPGPQEVASSAGPTPAERISISPHARKLAEEKGVDYTKLRGTGPGGRIVAEDVEKAAAAKPMPTQAPPPPAKEAQRDDELPALEVTPDEADVEDASFRMKTVARRLVASKRSIPHFYVTQSVDVTALMGRMKDLKEKYSASVTHVIMLACLEALKRHPHVNRTYDRGKIIRWKNVNLGLAVDTDEGLTVAVIAKAQTLSLKEIVERTNAVVAAARAGKLSLEQRRHPTFTITSLGMFGVEEFHPIINPPSSVTLGAAAALETPVARDGEVRVARVMKLTLSCDHRAVDGVGAARFLNELRGLLEDPDRMLAEG
jgi:pyruvate dehydrogenase E2 component (dihydrolipoamide acetyltransferase)